MKTTVTIEWDKPQEQAWLCPENIAIALHAYCKNTEIKVTESLSQPTDDEIEKEAKRLQQEDQKNLTWTFSPVSFIKGACYARAFNQEAINKKGESNG